MTEHPIDQARARFEDYVEEGMGYEPSRGEAMAVLDALAAAEHRIARLEAQTDIRGRAVVIYRERAREAEVERDEWRQTALDERAAALDALEQIKAREARIKAVLDMCDDVEDPDQWPPRPVMHGGEPFPESLMVHDIRRALDGDA